jgi:hypothetical protein
MPISLGAIITGIVGLGNAIATAVRSAPIVKTARLAYDAVKPTLKTLGQIGTVVGGVVGAVEASNRGDIGKTLYQGGKALNTMADAESHINKTRTNILQRQSRESRARPKTPKSKNGSLQEKYSNTKLAKASGNARVAVKAAADKFKKHISATVQDANTKAQWLAMAAGAVTFQALDKVKKEFNLRFRNK